MRPNDFGESLVIKNLRKAQNELRDENLALSRKNRELSDDLERAREKLQRISLKQCPECHGNGGQMQRMGRDGACVEYCECWFCDDRLNLSEYEIKAKRSAESWEDKLLEIRILVEEVREPLEKVASGAIRTDTETRKAIRKLAEGLGVEVR